MKKTIIAVTLLITAMIAWAGTGSVYVGPKASVGMSGFYGSDADDYSMKIGFGGGIFMNFGVTESFKIQPEAIVERKGAKIDFFGSSGSLNMYYISIPLLARFEFLNASNKLFLLAGPQISFLTSAKITDLGSAPDIDFTDKCNNPDFGLAFGAGINVNNVEVELRYNLGLSNVPDEEDTKLKNQYVCLNIGYAFLAK